MLRIAIQKKGRLYDDSMSLLKEIGIKISGSKNALKAEARNFPLEVLFLRNSDIPKYVESGIADVGILGQNTLIEKEKDINTLLELGFSKCRLSLAVPKNIEYSDVNFFEGKRIATSYPNTLKKYLAEKNINAEIHEIAGSVEVAPSIGLAEGICDLVESGNTLFMNGMKEVEVMLKSQAVFVANKSLQGDKKELVDNLLFRIKAALKAKKNKYIVLNIPNEKIEEAGKLLPAMKSPTVIPLAEKGWSALHSVVNENDFWDSIDKLKEIGAEGILVIPIEKMVI